MGPSSPVVGALIKMMIEFLQIISCWKLNALNFTFWFTRLQTPLGRQKFNFWSLNRRNPQFDAPALSVQMSACTISSMLSLLLFRFGLLLKSPNNISNCTYANSPERDPAFLSHFSSSESRAHSLARSRAIVAEINQSCNNSWVLTVFGIWVWVWLSQRTRSLEQL